MLRVVNGKRIIIALEPKPLLNVASVNGKINRVLTNHRTVSVLRTAPACPTSRLSSTTARAFSSFTTFVTSLLTRDTDLYNGYF